MNLFVLSLYQAIYQACAATMHRLRHGIAGILASLVILAFSNHAIGSGALIEVTDSDTRIELSGKLEYAKDKRFAENASPSDIDANMSHWNPVINDSDNLGLRSGTYWFRATLINRGNQTRDLLLVNDFPSINQLSLYRIDAQGSVTTLIEKGGLDVAHHPRANPHRKLAADFLLAPNETVTLLWRVESQPLFRFRPLLWEQKTFYQRDHIRTLLFGLLYGSLIMLVVYNFFLWISTEDKTYLYYLLYLFTTGYMMSANEGDLYQFVLPAIDWPKLALYVITYAVSVSSFCLVTSTFLTLRRTLPGHNLAMQITAGTAGLLMLIGGFFSQENALLSAIWIGSVLYLLALIAGIRMRLRGMIQAGYFVIALFMLLFSMIATGLALSGLLPITTGVETYSALGSVLMLVFFALALADKVNQLRSDNNLLLQKLIEADQVIKTTKNTLSIVRREKTQLEEENADNQDKSHLKLGHIKSMGQKIKSALGTINNASQQLQNPQQTAESEQIAEPYSAINTASRSVDTIITEMMDFSQIASEPVQISINQFRITDIVEISSRLLQERLPAQQFTISSHIDEKVPEWLRGDGQRISETLIYLVSHLCQRDSETPHTISLHCSLTERQSVNSVELQIIIKDAEQQLDDESRNAYFAGNKLSTAMQYEQQGLGLIIATELIHAMDGKIRLLTNKEYVEGIGFCVTIRCLTEIGSTNEEAEEPQ